MPDSPAKVEQTFRLLRENPLRIAEIAAGLSPTQLHTSIDPEAWSAVEIIAHLRSCADVWGGYIAKILAEDAPAIRAISPRAWIKRTDYIGKEFNGSFAAFEAQRADLLSVLSSLPPEDWLRSAKVTKDGRTRIVTVLDYGDTLARHERLHVAQLAEIAGIRMESE